MGVHFIQSGRFGRARARVVASSQASQTAGATAHTITLPGGIQAGDLILIFVGWGFSITTIPSTPAGLTLVDSQIVSTNWGFAVYSRVADGSETSYNFASVGNTRGSQIAAIIRGADTGAAINTSKQTTSATTTNIAFAGITTSHTLPLVFWCGHGEYAVGTNSASLSVASLSGVTTVENNTDGGNKTDFSAVVTDDDGSTTDPGDMVLSLSAAIRAVGWGVAVESL